MKKTILTQYRANKTLLTGLATKKAIALSLRVGKKRSPLQLKTNLIFTSAKSFVSANLLQKFRRRLTPILRLVREL
jgi:hypothetical protein